MSATSIIKDSIMEPQPILNAAEHLEHTENTDLWEFQLCSQLASCELITDFKEQIATITQKLGFSDFSFVALEGKSVRSMTTLHEDFCQQYTDGNFADQDLFLEHASISNSPIYLSDLDEYISRAPFSSERLNSNRELFNLYMEYGYQDYYCVPRSLQNHPGKVMFAVANKGSSREEFRLKVEKNKAILSLLIDAVVYFGISKFPDKILCNGVEGDVAITPKPLRLLTVMAREGLMLKDAAIKLCISVDTANKHMAAAKQALGASTLANAVYLAMTHGLIKEEEG